MSAICRRWWRAASGHRANPSLDRPHAQELIAKIPRTRRWRATAHGHQAMGTSLYLREHHFPNVYATRSNGLIIFAKDNELTVKEPMRQFGGALRARLLQSGHSSPHSGDARKTGNKK